MTSLRLVLWLIGLLLLIAAAPASWVLLREALHRRRTARAFARVDAARRFLAGATEPGNLAEALRAQFDPDTIARALEQMLRATEPAIRATAAALFRQLDLVPRYAQLLRQAPKWSERTHAAEILGLAAAPASVPALVACLNDPTEDEASVKVAATAALARLRDPTAIPLLVQELLVIDERSSRNVAEALVSFGGLAVPELLGLLGNPNSPAARVWAARILGRIKDRRATDDLIARLQDRDDMLRAATAEALGELEDARAIQPLVRATLTDPAPQVRAYAAGAVARIQGDRAVDVLVTALADSDYSTRLRALEAFETIKVADTSPLESALRDPNANVRRRAALALERVGYLERIIGELTAPERNTRERAYAALLELATVGLLDSVVAYIHHPSLEVRSLVARACGELGAVRVAPLLLARLDDESWPVRASVAEAIGKLKPPGGAAALVHLLGDAEEPVREGAAEALANFPDEDLEPHIQVLSSTYDRGSVPARTQVVVIVARLAGPDADALLVRASTESQRSGADARDGVFGKSRRRGAGGAADRAAQRRLARGAHGGHRRARQRGLHRGLRGSAARARRSAAHGARADRRRALARRAQGAPAAARGVREEPIARRAPRGGLDLRQVRRPGRRAHAGTIPARQRQRAAGQRRGRARQDQRRERS